MKKIGKPAVPALIVALKEGNKSVRNQVILVLTEIGPDAKEAIPLLQEAAKDADKDISRAAQNALKKIQ